MASKDTWSKAKYFRPTNTRDQWGDADAIADDLILKLDDFRRDVGSPIYILRGVATTGHTDGSYHYPQLNEQGEVTRAPCAVDLVVPGYQLTPFDLVTQASRFGFTGIGYYPHWRWNGQRVGGLHLDTRPLKLESDGTMNYRHNRWMGVLNSENKQEYIALTFHNLWKHTKELHNDGNNRLH